MPRAKLRPIVVQEADTPEPPANIPQALRDDWRRIVRFLMTQQRFDPARLPLIEAYLAGLVMVRALQDVMLAGEATSDQVKAWRGLQATQTMLGNTLGLGVRIPNANASAPISAPVKSAWE